MSYATPDDVCSAFPRFQRNTPGQPQDTDIQGWLDDAKAYIRALFLKRGIDPDGAYPVADPIAAPPGPNTDQQNILRKLNRESGIKDLASVLRYNSSAVDMGAFGASQEAPRSPMTASRFRDGRFDEITLGIYDVLFFPQIAKHTLVGATIPGSIAGGDQYPELTPEQRGLNCAFWKGETFVFLFAILAGAVTYVR